MKHDNSDTPPEAALSDVLTFAETAALLRLAQRSWRRQWRALVATGGFPAPLPQAYASQRPRRTWSRAQVLAWIENNGQRQVDAAPAAASDAAFEARLKGWESRHAE